MLALVLTVAVLGSAASDESRGLLVGGRIGFDFSTPVNSDHWTRTDRRTGVVLGLQVAVPLTHYLWLQPEVSFAGKEFTDWSDSARDMVPVSASYVGVSVIPMVTTRLGPIRAHAGVVPEFTFLVSDTANYADITVQPRRSDLQLGIAGGLSMPVGRQLLVGLEARYLHGLLGMENLYRYEGGTYRMTTWQFAVDIMWRVKH